MLKKQIFTLFLLLTSICFSQSSYKMLVGTYTRGTTSKGIYSLEFSGKGKLLSQKLLATSDNPSYLALSPDGKNVYAVNETGTESTVSAFAFDREHETLTFINKVNAGGADPCFITVTDNHVFTANYSGGSISVFGRKAGGAVTDTLKVIRHQRKNFGRGRFGPSNAHQVLFSPDRKVMIATNLGTDHVFSYSYNPDDNKNTLKYIDQISVRKHSGPRHTVFSADGRYLYLVQELDAGLTVFSVNEEGRLRIIQETTLVTDSSKKNGAADIHLSPDGKYLYATNRGEANNISCFKVNKNGSIAFKAQYPTEGNGPRNFTITPDGKFVFVANQRTNNITVFSRNKYTGKLTLTDNKVELGAPVCLLQY